jgi:hypothetical protein
MNLLLGFLNYLNYFILFAEPSDESLELIASIEDVEKILHESGLSIQILADNDSKHLGQIKCIHAFESI